VIGVVRAAARAISQNNAVGEIGMQRLTACALCGALVLLGSSAAVAEVRVNFVGAEHYTDAKLHNGYGAAARAPALHEIVQTLDRLGERYLRQGQTLSIEVLDIDLAGRFEPWHALAHDVRFMRDITWPRIKLRYRLTENGQPTRAAEEDVSDQTYLMHARARATGEIMPYEKAMLESWFRQRFAEH
jgi:Protein of unknown function (DUF3016)